MFNTIADNAEDLCAFGRVPSMVACPPRNIASEWIEEIEQDPADDDIIVNANQKTDSNHCIANTWENKENDTEYMVGLLEKQGLSVCLFVSSTIKENAFLPGA